MLLIALALAARLVALPFSTLDSADSATRVWMSWRWLDHPSLITEGVWGPLHFYLIGAALRLWPDPVATPTALHILLGSAVPVVVYLLAEELFGERRPALLAGVAWSIYPIAIATSVVAASQTPFALFFGLALLFLARARRPSKTGAWPAVLAGLAFGLASMLRYEAWLLLPFLTLMIIHRPRQAGLFLAVGLIHPVFWMTGNLLAHGDPFYSFTWASEWERDAMGGGAAMTLSNVTQSVRELVERTARGLSLPLSLLIVTGVGGSLVRGRRWLVWLLPPLGLFLLFVVGTARGSLVVKWPYTATYGLLLMPFVAYAGHLIGVGRWSPRRFAASLCGLILLVAACTVRPLWRDLPVLWRLYAPAAPAFEAQSGAEEVLELVRSARRPGADALVSDFYGWLPTYYVALHTGWHPDRIVVAEGAPNVPLDVSELERFLVEHPKGVLVTREGGRLTSLIRFYEDGSATFGTVRFLTEPVRGVAPAPEIGGSPISVDRYTLVGSSGAEPLRPR